MEQQTVQAQAKVDMTADRENDDEEYEDVLVETMDSADMFDLDEVDLKSWTRTGVREKDELHYYLTGLHYDCTFSIANAESGPQTFKCHKLFLAVASGVFENMLLGSFEEAAKGRDDEIKIVSKVSPAAFDLAMRFIYGNVRDFVSCKLAVELYYFAHEWMIKTLLEAAAEFLRKKLSSDEVLMAYEMFLSLGIDSELEFCEKIIKEKTRAVLKSEQWLGVSEKTVISIFSLSNLHADETDLFNYLVKWGGGDSSADDSTIRAKIDKCLKLIRFRSMSCNEFTSICRGSKVLTDEESLNILMSISLFDKGLMPPGFVCEAHPRNLDFATPAYKLRWDGLEKDILSIRQVSGEQNISSFASTFSFYLEVSGLYLSSIFLYSLYSANKGKKFSVTCKLRKANSSDQVLSMASFDGIYKLDDANRNLVFETPVVIEKLTVYTITIEHTLREPIETVRFKDPRAYLKYKDFNLCFPPENSKIDICGVAFCKKKA